jgi:carnitine 3-dehydrogenase
MRGGRCRALRCAACRRRARLSFHGTHRRGGRGRDWVQESVPERLEIKHKVFAEIIALRPEAVIGSSTSGFKPSELNESGRARHRRAPVQPGLPAAAGGTGRRCGAARRAPPILRGIGMFPLTVRKEIDAHIADRFLEAVWREALWLVKDGVATTEEIDEAIRMGFGLRWAQMGLFETYRIAGGEAGMRHFLAQFGPCAEMALDEADGRAGVHRRTRRPDRGPVGCAVRAPQIRELERLRDDNLVAMMRALKRTGSGAGASSRPMRPPSRWPRPGRTVCP